MIDPDLPYAYRKLSKSILVADGKIHTKAKEIISKSSFILIHDEKNFN